MSDKDFWLIVKRALMMVVKAIERKYPTRNELVDVSTGSITITHLPDLPDD